MAAIPEVTVIEHCRVAPLTGGAAELSLALTFYDSQWLRFHPIQSLILYKFPQPRSHFIKTIVPMLKESLSLALKHFLPVAGNLIYPPPDSGKPEMRFVEGDSVALTFAESSDDFDYLVQNHARNAERFYPLVPQLPSASTSESGTKIMPLLALQVTVFPHSGISIACTRAHVLGDASTVVGFLKAWSLISKLNGDAQFLASSFLPSYDRAMIKDPYNLLDKTLKMPWDFSQSKICAVDTVRATFEMSRADIQKLKNFVLAKRPTLVHTSSFTVTCAYIWTCWLKSLDAIGEKVDEDEPETFLCAANYRGLLDPPLPPTYFGNCVVPCIATTSHGELVGSEGLYIAAALIGEAIQERMQDREGILNGNWITQMETVLQNRKLGVSGSPKFSIYETDFGWGKPEKIEVISIEVDGAMSLDMSRKYEGGLEVGLSSPKTRMDAFTTIFNSGLGML